jgi:nucleoside-diphosphate-sugar epimerase
VARALSGGGELVSRVIHKPPLLPSGQLTFLLWDAAPDSTKAQDELGWQPTALEDGLRRTLESMGLV